MQEGAYCKDHPKQRRSRLRGGRPQWTGAARFWPKALASLLFTVGHTLRCSIRLVMRWKQESRHNVQALTLELQGFRDRSPTRARQDTVQQTELPAAQSELEPREHGDASPRQVFQEKSCVSSHPPGCVTTSNLLGLPLDTAADSWFSPVSGVRSLRSLIVLTVALSRSSAMKLPAASAVRLSKRAGQILSWLRKSPG